ncbi:MAG TPA: 4-hydroxythreonine-4-phosphate dehydrogenase PdxA [Candidatus Hydrogenedentes bacterium]|mgnify:CR=1 FL=1|nr:4-hydroxythreonine-4-phosphate dehydrogenase PdxA [Candidatus Hydrogenedentota bacterium]
MTDKNNNTRPLLGVTLGDCNGVGPEILAKALARLSPQVCCSLLVFGSLPALEAMRIYAPDMPALYEVDSLDALPSDKEGVPVYNAGCSPSLNPGTLAADAGGCAAAWIETAAIAALEGRIQGMITCPVNKEGMLLSGCPYAGHTPMLASLTGARECHMSLFSERMRIVHITAHLSLSDAVKAVTKERVLRAVEAGAAALRRIGFAAPRIAVAGLNPHAGEAGAFGNEEATAIAPAIAAACEGGVSCVGPFSPDTVFQRMYAGEFDMVIAMYHDQGHIPFKLIARDEGVHVTLGLPFIRTSPDHGTAYDIAGKGVARANSMIAAIELAAQWTRRIPNTVEK